MSSSNFSGWSHLPEPAPADLERACAGDQQAFRLLVERYQAMVYAIAYSLLGQPADAEDAAQEAFLRLYRKLGQFRGQASFTTWLYRLAVRAALDEQRRRRRSSEAYDLMAGVTAAGVPLAVDAVHGRDNGGWRDRGGHQRSGDAVADAEAQALQRLDAAAVMAALRELPVDDRIPVVLRDIHGFAYKEIAEMTGRPAGTIRVMVHRGRGALRLRLRAAGVFGEER
jgi:RNA polymerase sigma-70 factor (ECF subfamily)